MARLLLILPLVFLLSACVTDKTASSSPSVYYYGLQGGAATAAGIHTVAAGDTPWTIAQDYRLSVQELIAVNDLSPPYKLRPGQRVVLPPPATYEARQGDTLYSISRTFSVSQTQLAQMNGLQRPFAVAPGQMLRLPTAQPVLTQASAPVPPPAPRFAVWRPYVERVFSSHHGDGRFIWPVSGPVISAYGPKLSGLHNDGINIRATRGAPVLAADDGTVVYAGNELKGFGNLILLRHKDRWMTAYAHMDRLNVRRGQTVRRGEMIGAVGSTGSADSPQLHFEVRHGTEALNPAMYLGQHA